MTALSYTIYYNLPFPRVCLSWQTVQSLMRRRVMLLICVYAVCTCIQPVPQVRTLNFRLATRLNLHAVWTQIRLLHMEQSDLGTYFLLQGFKNLIDYKADEYSPEWP